MLSAGALNSVSPRFRAALDAPGTEVVMAVISRRTADLYTVLQALRSRGPRAAAADCVFPLVDVLRMALQVQLRRGVLALDSSAMYVSPPYAGLSFAGSTALGAPANATR
jgi:hypothetical protein